MHVARQSALDKAKADAKAKKLRDEREAASALEDFVKEFDADLSDDGQEWQTGGIEGGILHSSTQGSGARVSMGRGRRHFTAVPKHVFPLKGAWGVNNRMRKLHDQQGKKGI
jgi:RNA recognition motif. (a.k.a. RRM, RBD, or RNP domain)